MATGQLGGLCHQQTIATLRVAGKRFYPYFFRTSDQYEIDLVLDFGGELWAVEIKLAGSPSVADMERLHRTADLIKARRRIFVRRSTEFISGGDTMQCSLGAFLKTLLA